MPLTYPLLSRIHAHAKANPDKTAIIDAQTGTAYSYAQLRGDVVALAGRLGRMAATGGEGEGDLQEMRVGVLANKGYGVVVALLAVWAAGGLCIPLLPSHPRPEQVYMLQNAGARLILHDGAHEGAAGELVREVEACKAERIPEVFGQGQEEASQEGMHGWKELDGERRAMMLYTSGTTGRPKGVVTRHLALASQVEAIVKCWHWQSDDLLLHVLPLNHLHGIVVALLTTLWAGAAVELWQKLDGVKVWRRWINEEGKPPISLMFGVPTVYAKLIAAHASLPPDEQARASAASARLRLQVSGSAPLPLSVKSTWEAEGGVGGGQILIERYGMTEIGIALSTGFDPSLRVGGHVGFPLSNVQVRLWDAAAAREIPPTEPDTPGEIQVRGPGIFKEYWGLSEATASEFDGQWFKTGDIGARSAEHEGMYKILGRSSVDIIKSGGEKLSALDIERSLLELEYITDAAVVGVPSDEWGQLVGAIVVSSKADLRLEDLRRDLRDKIASYKLPRALKVYPEIPRNGMGKVNKKTLVVEAFPPA